MNGTKLRWYQNKTFVNETSCCEFCKTKKKKLKMADVLH